MTRAVRGATQSTIRRSTGKSNLSVLNHLTERDTEICLLIHEHRFLTTGHIFELFFTSYRKASQRVHQLYQLGILDRFRPPRRPGSSPWHYVLGRLGADLVAGQLDMEKAPPFNPKAAYRLAQSPRLQHMRDVNDFFCRLAFAGRRSEPPVALSLWLGETKSRELCTNMVRPDGTGQLEHNDTALQFYLEMDRGSESGSRLRDKIIDYQEAVISRHLPRVLLFCFPSERREESARRALVTSRLVVLTATMEQHLSDPLGANWWPIDASQRSSLLDLSDPRVAP